jgi:hypothetical protein
MPVQLHPVINALRASLPLVCPQQRLLFLFARIWACLLERIPPRAGKRLSGRVVSLNTKSDISVLAGDKKRHRKATRKH